MPSSWDGGLPPAAHARAERQRSSGVAGSLLSAAGAAAIRSVALQPVGEVFGSVVMQLAWSGGGCGLWNASGPMSTGFGAVSTGGGTAALRAAPYSRPFGSPTYNWDSPVLTTGGTGGRRAGFGSYVHAWVSAWRGAHDRMVAEASILGADGVVGVTVARKRLDAQVWEFTALGTAVRSLDASVSPSRSGAAAGRNGAPVGRNGSVRPWTAGFSAEHVTALLQSGWVPRGMALGLSVSTKHEDQQLRNQRSLWAGNTEIDGLTAVLRAARDDARVQLTRHAGSLAGSDLVVSDASVAEFDTPCGNEHDLHAEARFVGTVIAPGPMHAFGDRSAAGGPRRSVLPVLPLDDPATRSARRGHRP